MYPVFEVWTSYMNLYLVKFILLLNDSRSPLFPHSVCKHIWLDFFFYHTSNLISITKQ